MPSAEFIRVTARVRPSASRIPQERILEVLDDKNIRFDPRNPKTFAFDAVFGEDVDQEQVYDEVASRIIDGCIGGYNSTIFAYGQTGSGKTHTMLGPQHVENFMLNPAQRGLIPRACEALFQKLCTQTAEKGDNFKYAVSCKFVELYNEDFFDLLGDPLQKLAIRSDSTVVQILGVSKHSVHSSIDMMKILEIGWDARRKAETAMNQDAKAHLIFLIEITTKEVVNNGFKKRTAILKLLDLAGPDNLSLSHLGRLVLTLAEANHRASYVPYRDCNLTKILRQSFVGNSRTSVIVTLHPEKRYFGETLATLNFSASCRKIKSKVHANENFEERGVRREMEEKIAAVQEDMERWKQLAMERERTLVEAQLQRDFFAAQLLSGSNEGERFGDEILNEMMTKLWERIDIVKDYREMSRVQLENDLSNALRQLDQMHVRLNSFEAARKQLNEKLSEISPILHKLDVAASLPERSSPTEAPTAAVPKSAVETEKNKKKKEKGISGDKSEESSRETEEQKEHHAGRKQKDHDVEKSPNEHGAGKKQEFGKAETEEEVLISRKHQEPEVRTKQKDDDVKKPEMSPSEEVKGQGGVKEQMESNSEKRQTRTSHEYDENPNRTDKGSSVKKTQSREKKQGNLDDLSDASEEKRSSVDAVPVETHGDEKHSRNKDDKKKKSENESSVLNNGHDERSADSALAEEIHQHHDDEHVNHEVHTKEGKKGKKSRKNASESTDFANGRDVNAATGDAAHVVDSAPVADSPNGAALLDLDKKRQEKKHEAASSERSPVDQPNEATDQLVCKLCGVAGQLGPPKQVISKGHKYQKRSCGACGGTTTYKF